MFGACGLGIKDGLAELSSGLEASLGKNPPPANSWSTDVPSEVVVLNSRGLSIETSSVKQDVPSGAPVPFRDPSTQS